MPRSLFFLALVLLSGVAGARHVHARPALPALVPMPRCVRALPGRVALGPDWTIVAPRAEDRAAADVLVDEVHALHGWTWRIVTAAAGEHVIEFRSVVPVAAWERLRSEQGYRLAAAPRRVVIAGATATGRFYGAQTLAQLVRGAGANGPACVAIEDWPSLEWRGISDDVSRGQVSTLADFRATVRAMAGYKLNLYQPYIEDLSALQADAPSGTAGALSRADLAALVAEGQRWHVVVSPVYESISHQERLLAAPAYRRFAAGAGGRWGGFAAVVRRWFGHGPALDDDGVAPATFATDDREALRCAQELAATAAAVSGPPFFHMGGDEWQPPAGTRVADVGRADADRGYGEFMAALAQHVRRVSGCRPMLYGDVLIARPAAALNVPRDVIVVDWQYTRSDSFPSLARLRALGFHDVIVSPGLWSWGTFHPDFGRAFPNIAAFADAGRQSGALGCVAASWGDDGAENLRANNWPGYAYVAAAAWEERSPRAAEFLQRFTRVHFGADGPGLARAERLAGWQAFERTGVHGRLYHRLPAVRPRLPEFAARMRTLRADMLAARGELAAAAPTVRLHKEQFAALQLDVDRYGLVAERELLLDALGSRLLACPAGAWPGAERAAAAAGLAALAARSDTIAAAYRGLWLAANRPEGLEPNAARLARESVMLRRLATRARDGRLRVDDAYARLQALAAAR